MARGILTKAPLAIVIDRATIRPQSGCTLPQLPTTEPKPMPRYNLHFTINTTGPQPTGEWNEFEHADVATDSIDTSVLAMLELYPQCSSMVIVVTFPRRAN